MNIGAIVYTSNTGHTKQYAEMLGAEFDMQIYNLNSAIRRAEALTGVRILYMGWLMAGKIQGYTKANKKLNISCVCAVGMDRNQSQLNDIITTNKIPSYQEVFLLQGGFELEKLTGIYKFMMLVMKKTVGKKLQNKKDKNDEEKEMLHLLKNGGNKVNINQLIPVFDYINHN